MRHPFLTGGRPAGLAHRGGSARIENSWSGFQAAVALGYTHLETDARSTADGRVVLFHDATLARTTGHPGRVGHLTYAELCARIGGREPIPLLEEVLGAFPETRLNVDLKSDPTVEPFVDIVQRCRAHERMCVASFSDHRIRRAVGRLGGRVCVSAGPQVVTALRVAALAPHDSAPPFLIRPDVVQVPVRLGPVPLVTAGFVRALHRWGIAVHAWTVNDPVVMEALLDLGVDGLISDETVVLRQVLSRRGRWPPG